MFSYRNKFYFFVTTAILVAYIWLFFSLNTNQYLSICFTKTIFKIPCPSCGSTRAVKLFVIGNYFESILTNPIGIIIVLVLAILPFWIVIDLLVHRSTLLDSYMYFERVLKNKYIFTLVLLLIFSNWIWNINKGL